MVDGRSILALVSLAAEYGTTLAVEAHGVDAEEAVAALAQLISAPSRDCENQTGEAGRRNPDSPAAQGAQTEGHSTASPENQHGDHSLKSGPRWDSWRLGPTRGSRNDRRGATRGRWLRRGSHSRRLIELCPVKARFRKAPIASDRTRTIPIVCENAKRLDYDESAANPTINPSLTFWRGSNSRVTPCRRCL